MGVYLWNNVYEYGYDFRGKTIAQVKSDGWTFTNSDESSATIDSNGLIFSPMGALYYIPSGLSTMLSTATKITMELYFYKAGQTGSGASNTQSLLTSGLGVNNYTGYFGDYRTIACRAYGTNIFSSTYTIATGEYTVTTVVDLVNKTITVNYPGIVERSGSITDAQITNIRTSQTFRVAGDTPAIIKTASIKIEE